MEDHRVFAYHLNGKGGAEQIDCNTVSEMMKEKKLIWVHLDATHAETGKWLKKEVSSLDQYTIDALTQEETRPRIAQVENGIMVILRGANLNEGADPTDMVSIRMWVEDNRIFSMSRRNVSVVQDMEKKLHAGKGPTDAGEFMALLINLLYGRMAPILSELDDRMDDVEEALLIKPDAGLRSNLTDIRMQAITFRRHIAPQYDVTAQFRVAQLPWLDKHDRRLMHEAQNQIMRYVEDLESIRDRAVVAKDELSAELDNALNRNMYLLSIISAIFLPASFLTGLLGVNLGGIPGANNPYAFWFFCGFLALLLVWLLIVLKKIKLL